jgi:hypothetical protein
VSSAKQSAIAGRLQFRRWHDILDECLEAKTILEMRRCAATRITAWPPAHRVRIFQRRSAVIIVSQSNGLSPSMARAAFGGHEIMKSMRVVLATGLSSSGMSASAR